MNIQLDNLAIMPTRAHKDDAGIDLYSPIDIKIKKHSSVVIDTGVHMAIPKGTAGFLKSRSGLNVKHDITSTGVIDTGYTGSIKVKLYNNGNKAYTVNRGDKISQLVVLPLVSLTLDEVEELDQNTERGDNGFGSTDQN